MLSVNRKNRTALLRFSNDDLAQKARKRIDKENVFGFEISARIARQLHQQQKDVETAAATMNGGVCTKNGHIDPAAAAYSTKRQILGFIENIRQPQNSGDVNCQKVLLELNHKQKAADRGTRLLNNIFNSCCVKNDRFKAINYSPSSESRSLSLSLSPQSNELDLDSDLHFSHRSDRQGNTTDRRNNGAVVNKDFQLKEASRILRHFFDQTGLLQDGDQQNAITFSTDKRLNKSISVPQIASQSLKSKPYMATFTNSSRLHPVDVRVDNIDSSMSIRSLKENLYSIFSAVVRVLHVTVVPQSTGGWFALVQVASKREAIEAVNRLNQIEFGKSHIIVSISSSQSFGRSFIDEETLKQEAYELLAKESNKSMPLATFQDALQLKLKRPVSVSDIKSITDVVRVEDGFKTVRCYLVDKENPLSKDNSCNNNHNHKGAHDLQSIRGGGSSTSSSDKNGDLYKRHTNGGSATYNGRRRSHFCYCSKPDMSDWNFAQSVPRLLCCKLRDEIVTLLNNAEHQTIPMSELSKRYYEAFNTKLDPVRLGFFDLNDMIDDMQGLIEKITEEGSGIVMLNLRKTSQYQAAVEAVLHLFLARPDKELTLREFQDEYRHEFGVELQLHTLNATMTDVIEMFEGRNGIIGIRLTPVQKFALRVRRLLLFTTDGYLSLVDLERQYRLEYGERLRCRAFGFANVVGLLRAASHVLYLKGRGHSLTVCINRNFLGFEMKKRPSVTGVDGEADTLKEDADHSQSLSNGFSVITSDDHVSPVSYDEYESDPLTSSTPRGSVTSDDFIIDGKKTHESVSGFLRRLCTSQRSSVPNDIVLEPVSNFVVANDAPSKSAATIGDQSPPLSLVVTATSSSGISSSLGLSGSTTSLVSSSGAAAAVDSSAQVSPPPLGNIPTGRPRSRLAARFSYALKI